MRYSVLAVILLGNLLLCTSLLHADNTSFRCGNSLVSIGDTMSKVRRLCGNPLSEQQVGERRTFRIYKQEQLKIEDITYVTEWIYEKHQGEYILTFEGSRLVHKEYLK